MSRRHRAEKREIIPDPKYGDLVITKFMNSLMFEGKKSAAETIVYGALGRIEQKAKRDGLELFHEALNNVKPAIEVRSRRVGGATYQVPVEVRNDRRQALAIRWIINAARARNENTMEERLSANCSIRNDPRNRSGEARRHPQDGRGQPGFLALPMVEFQRTART